MEKNKVYISGPISGLIYEDVVKTFDKAESKLKAEGYEVVNPLNNGLSKDSHWNEHMRIDIKMMLDCDTIYMLSGWHRSKGAKIEHSLAVLLEFNTIYEYKDKI